MLGNIELTDKPHLLVSVAKQHLYLRIGFECTGIKTKRATV